MVYHLYLNYIPKVPKISKRFCWKLAVRRYMSASVHTCSNLLKRFNLDCVFYFSWAIGKHMKPFKKVVRKAWKNTSIQRCGTQNIDHWCTCPQARANNYIDIYVRNYVSLYNCLLCKVESVLVSVSDLAFKLKMDSMSSTPACSSVIWH